MPRRPKKPPGSPRGPAPASPKEGARRDAKRVGVRLFPSELAIIEIERKRLGLSREEVIRRGVLAYLYPATTEQ